MTPQNKKLAEIGQPEQQCTAAHLYSNVHLHKACIPVTTMQTKQMPVEKPPCSKPAEHFSSTMYSEKQAPTDWEPALDLGN